MIINDVVKYLEKVAHPTLQESYDNSGLLTGDGQWVVKGVLICLDSTEDVLEEAIANECNLIIAHHPIIFKGVKRLNGKNYIERILIKAIKNDIAIYAIHTNLDNIVDGVNNRIAQQLKLINRRILVPKSENLSKVVVFCPSGHAVQVRSALFDAGAGNIGKYDSCSFNLSGDGTFRGLGESNPFVGEVGIVHTEMEVRVEVIVPNHLVNSVIGAARKAHPYEEMAYDVYALSNVNPTVGSGMVGELEEAIPIISFLNTLKREFNCGVVRYTHPHKDLVKKIAVCGGSGSFLLGAAKAAGADVFVSADFKYHEFFDAEKDIIIADIGHFESEQYTIDLLADVLTEKFTTFAIRLAKANTNPINYL